MAGERVFTDDIIQELLEDNPQDFFKKIMGFDKSDEIVQELKPEFKLKGLYRDNPKTPEGKYLVLRRDGSVVEFPLFVLGARDPYAAKALVDYAKHLQEGITNGDTNIDQGHIDAILRWAKRFDEYRSIQGASKPCCRSDRQDCPAIIELMKKGESA